MARPRAVWPLALIATAGCSLPAAEEDTPPSAPVTASARADVPALGRANTAFALDLYARLREGEGNRFIAPSNLATTLAMASVGARGETAEQMAAVLHLPFEGPRLHAAFAALIRGRIGEGRRQGDPLRSAAALWVQEDYPVRQEFHDTLRTSFGARAHPVDFSGRGAVGAIDAWAAANTRGRITRLAPGGGFEPGTRLVLTGAVTFKAEWEGPFGEGATEDADFLAPGGHTLRVPMMVNGGPFSYLDGGAFQLLEMPYKGGAFVMDVLLPRAADGLPSLEEGLTADALGGWLLQCRKHENVIVYLPKFRMARSLELGRVLAAMGMSRAFDPRAADFSGINGGSEPLWLSGVIQETFVDVDERGTEAAAATAIGAKAAAPPEEPPPPPPVFRADHPFLFLIREVPSGDLLFLGRVTDPRG